MKTFEEALETVMMRKVMVEDLDPSKPLEEQAPAGLLDTFQKYQPIIREIQENQLAEKAVSMMLNVGQSEHLSFMDCMLMAFSHGVAVGMEMEKAEFTSPVEEVK